MCSCLPDTWWASTALVWFLPYAGTLEKDGFGASQELVQGFWALSLREGRFI